MAVKITQEEKDQATALDVVLKARRTYVATDTFIADEKVKVQGFLDSPHLGASMRAHLTGVKKVLVDTPEVRKAEELTRVNVSIVANDKILAKEVELSAV